MGTTLLILAGLGSGLIIVLLMSWHLRFRGSILMREEAFAYSAAVTLGGREFGFGVATRKGHRYLFIGSFERSHLRWRLSGKKKENRKRVTQKASEPGSWKQRLWRFKSLPVRGILSAIIRHVKWENFGLRGTLGLGDPGRTGQLYGTLAAISSAIPAGKYTLDLVPSFEAQMVRLECDSTFRFRPALMAWRVGLSFLRKGRQKGRRKQWLFRS